MSGAHGSGPQVSVVVPTRDRPALLARALFSVARQTLADMEVLVVDDGSHDDVQHEYGPLLAALGPRFALLRSSAPGFPGSGASATRNAGLERATAPFVAFLDDDDEWICDQYLETAVNALRAADADFCFADMEGYRAGKLVWDTWRVDKAVLAANGRVSPWLDAYLVDRKAVLRSASRRIIHLNTVVLRRTLVEEAGGFTRRLHYAEDHEFTIRQVDRARRFIFLPRIVARHELPQQRSLSASQAPLERRLQQLTAAQALRAMAQTAEVRRFARREEAWFQRMISRELLASGRFESARSFCWQSITSRPTPGTLAEFVRLCVRARQR